MANATTSITIELQDGQVVAAASRVNAALKRIQDQSNQLGNTSWDNFADGVKNFIQNPLQAAGEMAGDLLKALGPVGAGIAATGGAFALAGKEALGYMETLGQLGRTIENTALRTGLTTTEVSQFRFAAQAAGADVGVFESLMRKLSQGLADSGDQGKRAREGLADLGIQTRDVSGNLRGTSDILLQISQGLSNLPSGFERNAEALKLFGRAGIEAIPVMTELAANVKIAKDLGLGISGADVDRFAEYHRQLTEISALWEKMKRDFMSPIVATISVVMGGMLAPNPTFQYRNGQLVPTGGQSHSGPGRIYGNGEQWSEGDARAAGLTGNAPIDLLLNAIPGMNDTASAHAFFLSHQSAGTGVQRLQEELKSAQEAAGTAHGDYASLDKSGAGLTATQKAFSKWQDAEAQVKKYTDALKEAKQAETELPSFIEKMTKPEGLGPVGQIFSERDKFKGTNRGPATDAALIAAGRALDKEYAETYKQTAETWDRAGKEKTFSGESMGDYQKVFDEWLKQSNRDTLKDFTQKVETGKGILSINRDTSRSMLNEQASRATRIAEMQSGPGNEGYGIDVGYQQRVSLAHQLYGIEVDTANAEKEGKDRTLALVTAERDMKLDIYRADEEHEMKLMELQKARMDNFASQVGGGFDALVNGGARGLGNYFRSTGLGIGRTIAENAGRMIYPHVEGMFTLPGTTNDEGKPTGFGKLLAGTPMATNEVSAHALSGSAMQLNSAADALQDAAASLHMGGARRIGGGGYSFAGRGGFSGGGVTGDSDSSAVIDNTVNSDGEPIDTNITAAAMGGTSGMSLGKGIGIAGAAAGGIMGAISGFSKGTAKGDITGTASIAGAAGAIVAMAGVTGPLAPILAGAGLALGLISDFLGDSRAERQKQESNEAAGNNVSSPTWVDSNGNVHRSNYYLPPSMQMDVDMAGNQVGSNFKGGITVTNHFNVQTIDAQSWMDHSTQIMSVVSQGLTTHGPAINAVKVAAGTKTF